MAILTTKSLITSKKKKNLYSSLDSCISFKRTKIKYPVRRNAKFEKTNGLTNCPEKNAIVDYHKKMGFEKVTTKSKGNAA